jgi:hypothetical protein
MLFLSVEFSYSNHYPNALLLLDRIHQHWTSPGMRTTNLSFDSMIPLFWMQFGETIVMCTASFVCWHCATQSCLRRKMVWYMINSKVCINQNFEPQILYFIWELFVQVMVSYCIVLRLTFSFVFRGSYNVYFAVQFKKITDVK